MTTETTTRTARDFPPSTVVDTTQGRCRVLIGGHGAVRVRYADGTNTNIDPAHETNAIVARPGDRDHHLHLTMCQFHEWSHDWDRAKRDEPNNSDAWDDLHDTGIALLREFAAAAGVILDSDTRPPALDCSSCGVPGLRWHSGMGAWQAPITAVLPDGVGTGWSDRCALSRDGYHDPIPAAARS